MEQDAQQCVNGQWETQAQWTQRIIDTYWQQVFWHEFGHSMGLEHNFMGNIDQPNFTTQRDANGKPLTDANGNTLYHDVLVVGHGVQRRARRASPGRRAGAPTTRAPSPGSTRTTASSRTTPTKDATARREARAPASRRRRPGPGVPVQGPARLLRSRNDPGLHAPGSRARSSSAATRRTSRTRRSAARATSASRRARSSPTTIDDYEWQYQWRNFRDYRKVWDESAYANAVAGFIVDTRRFLSQWAFDWSPGEIATHALPHRHHAAGRTRRSAVDYYAQLTNKFLVEMSTANQMVAAFHEAIIQQAAGERPYATVYDKFYGDVTQQGIILDKYFAMQNFVGLWNSDNYDQNQARRVHLVVGRASTSTRLVPVGRRDGGRLDDRLAVRRVPVLHPDRGRALRAGHAQPGVPRRRRARRGEGLDRRLGVHATSAS